MFKSKQITVFVTTICVINLFAPTYCQLSESSTLDVITDGMKSMFGLDQVVKTFRKISEGMIPFPLFVPIMPKNRVIELFRGKKQSKDQELADQIAGKLPCLLLLN